jgi:alcohol dehydrogenase
MSRQIVVEGENIQLILEWLKNNDASKIFIVTGKNSFKSSGSKKYLQSIINQYKYVIFSDFNENPEIDDVYKGIDIINNEKCDCCIAIGGGSVLDMGKLICYLKEGARNKPDLIVQGKLSNVKRKIPICAIPTTAGSGSESTHFAVVYINNKKFSIAHETILPDIVNLNPNLSYTLPLYLKAITGLDALAQGIESYWSKNATIKSRKYSADAIELVWNNLKQSVLENSFRAHTKVVMGSNLAGRAINIAKTTAAHAISYYFTSKHNINHGHAVALTLGKVYEYNYLKAMHSNEEHKELFVNLNLLFQIKENPKEDIEKFIFDLNIEIDYSKLNINIEEEIPRIVKEVNIERLRNNPFKFEEGDIEKLILNK